MRANHRQSISLGSEFYSLTFYGRAQYQEEFKNGRGDAKLTPSYAPPSLDQIGFGGSSRFLVGPGATCHARPLG